MNIVEQRMAEHAAVLEATKALQPSIEKRAFSSKRRWKKGIRFCFVATVEVPLIRST